MDVLATLYDGAVQLVFHRRRLPLGFFGNGRRSARRSPWTGNRNLRLPRNYYPADVRESADDRFLVVCDRAWVNEFYRRADVGSTGRTHAGHVAQGQPRRRVRIIDGGCGRLPVVVEFCTRTDAADFSNLAIANGDYG